MSDPRPPRSAPTSDETTEPMAPVDTEALLDGFAGLVHELRTPVVGVMGGCDLLESTKLDATQRRYVTMVRASANALLAQANNLLDLRRAEHAELLVSDVPFYLYETLEAVFDVVAESASAAECELVYEVAPGTPTYLIGDEDRVHQVLLNLVSNAIRYAPDGPIEIRVSSTPRGDGVGLTCWVDDHGAGIPEGERDQLFIPFWQRTDPRRRRQTSGLGLAVSRRVARQLGGDLSVAERPGGGARFIFEVPLLVQSDPVRRTLDLPQDLLASVVEIAVGNQALNKQLVDLVTGLGPEARTATTPGAALLITDDKRRAEQARADEIPVVLICEVGGQPDESTHDWSVLAPVRRRDLAVAMRGAISGVPVTVPPSTLASMLGRRILLVDDARENRELIARLLSRWGYVVTEASTGAEALERFGERAYSAVLLDIFLGDESGEDVLDQLRALEQGKPRSTPIAAMTAAVRKQDIERLLGRGFDAHIPKPVTRQELKTSLHALAERARTRPPVAASSEAPSAPSSQPSASVPLPEDLHELRMMLLSRDWDGLDDALVALELSPWSSDLEPLRRAARARDVGAAQQALNAVAATAPEVAADAPTHSVLPSGEPPRPSRHREAVWGDEADRALLDELLPQFFAQRRHDAARLRLALVHTNLEEVRAIAHRIVGTAALYGFPALGEAAQALYATVRAGDTAACGPAIETVVAQIETILPGSSDAHGHAQR